MDQILELREKRAKLYRESQEFYKSHRYPDGGMSEEDDDIYEKMKAKVYELSMEIENLERQYAKERVVRQPIKFVLEVPKMKIMLDEGVGILPTRAYPQDAGLDIYSPVETVIFPRDSVVIDSGVHVELPSGTYGRLESKSGLHIKYDIICAGGTIDCGYNGSIRVKLYNMGDKPYMIRKGQKIVQLVIIPCFHPELEVVDKLDETERNDRGFGSSGL